MGEHYPEMFEPVPAIGVDIWIQECLNLIEKCLNLIQTCLNLDPKMFEPELRNV